MHYMTTRYSLFAESTTGWRLRVCRESLERILLDPSCRRFLCNINDCLLNRFVLGFIDCRLESLILATDGLGRPSRRAALHTMSPVASFPSQEEDSPCQRQSL